MNFPTFVNREVLSALKDKHDDRDPVIAVALHNLAVVNSEQVGLMGIMIMIIEIVMVMYVVVMMMIMIMTKMMMIIVMMTTMMTTMI